jgi:hypothetical protein
VYTSFRGRYRLVVTRVPARRVRLALCCLYKLTQKLKFPCCFLFMHSKSCGFFFLIVMDWHRSMMVFICMGNWDFYVFMTQLHV